MTTPEHLSDAGQIAILEKRLAFYCRLLTESVNAVAKARQIKDFNSDQRKRVLSVAMKPFLDDGDSATAAETRARASDWHGEQLIALAAAYEEAERALVQHDANVACYDAARSLLALQRQLVGLQ